jgi:hypothetical protein
MRTALLRALLGFLIGGLCGGLALMISLGRSTLIGSVGRGTPLIDVRQPGLALAFLTAFSLGGAILGLLAPLRRTELGAFGLGLLSASGFLATVYVGLEGTPTEWSPSVWWTVGAGTVLLGIVLADQLRPSDR